MSLFATPMTCNDGTADHVFSFRSQRPDPKSIVGDYIEDAAEPSAESLITAKQDIRSKTPRSLIQRRVNRHPAANTADALLLPITMNFTMVADKAFSVAELEEEFNILIAALSKSGVISGLRSKKI